MSQKVTVDDPAGPQQDDDDKKQTKYDHSVFLNEARRLRHEREEGCTDNRSKKRVYTADRDIDQCLERTGKSEIAGHEKSCEVGVEPAAKRRYGRAKAEGRDLD